MAQANDVVKIDATPQLLTKAGEWATLEDNLSMTYATEFDPPSIPAESSDSAAIPGETEQKWTTNDLHTIVPAHPTKFETKEHGIRLKFRPRLGNREKIFIDCEVEQISFDGYEEAPAPLSFEVPKPFGNRPNKTLFDNLHTRQPSFRIRNQEFLFSPSGRDFVAKAISEASSATPNSTEKGSLPKIEVSIEAKKLSIDGTQQLYPRDFKHL